MMMATITNGFNSSDGNIHGYAVTLPTGHVVNVTYQGSQAHCDNLAAALSDGGYLAALNAGDLVTDGVWVGLTNSTVSTTPHWPL
jgi:hypothetical protein